MGDIINAIKKFDQSGAELEEMKSQLDVLSDLAGTKAALAKEKIEHELMTAGSEMNKTVPISAIRDRTIETHAFASSDASAIVDTIKKSVNGFLAGGSANILDGVCGLLSTAITAFLGAGQGGDDVFERMYLVNDGKLSLLRFDVWGWRREAMGAGIKTKVQSVSAFVGVKSIVNFQRLDFPTFVNLYQQQLASSGVPEASMMEALKEAKNIFELMTPHNDGPHIEVLRPAGIVEAGTGKELLPDAERLARIRFDQGFLPRPVAG